MIKLKNKLVNTILNISVHMTVNKNYLIKLYTPGKQHKRQWWSNMEVDVLWGNTRQNAMQFHNIYGQMRISGAYNKKECIVSVQK